LGAFYHALVLEGHRCGLAIHRVTEVGLVAEDLGYGRRLPIIRGICIGDSTVFTGFGMAVHGGLEYLPIPKDIANVFGADARGAEGEYFSNDGRGFGIDDQMILPLGILHISVRDLGADTLATFGFGFDYGTYLLTGVTCVPLVKKVLKRRKLVALCVERIEVLIDGNIPNSKAWEYQLRILTDLNIVSAETGEIFGN